MSKRILCYFGFHKPKAVRVSYYPTYVGEVNPTHHMICKRGSCALVLTSFAGILPKSSADVIKSGK